MRITRTGRVSVPLWSRSGARTSARGPGRQIAVELLLATGAVPVQRQEIGWRCHGERCRRVFAALASSTRRTLLASLLERDGQPVQQLASHLAGGRRRIYRLEREALVAVQEWLEPYEQFWRQELPAMSALKDEAERAEREERSE